MMRFIGVVFRHFIGMWLALVLAMSLLLGSILGVAIAVFYSPVAEIKDDSVLVIDLGANIGDSPDESSPQDWLDIITGKERGSGTYLLEVLQAIERARDDDRIIGIMLKGAQFGSLVNAGFVQLSEVRSALEDFSKSTNKMIIAHLENPAVDEVYLASVADKVVMDPFGEMYFIGLAMEQMYFAEAFKKYGIGAQVVKVGKYKSAIEPYLRSDMSAESREQSEELINGMWSQIIDVIAKSRKVAPHALKELSQNQGLLLSSDAKKHNLVDEVQYYENAYKYFFDDDPDNNDTESINKLALRDYIDEGKSKKKSESDEKIAVVYIEGAMVDGEGYTYEVGGDRIASKLKKLRKDDTVKAVVLRVNSPGGSASAAEKIQREVRLIKEKKPVVVSMGDYAASGGYWVSAYSNKIFADPMTITGSIGVYGIIVNIKDFAEKFGVTFDRVLTGEFADLESVSQKKSERELNVLQRVTQFVYNVFIYKVSEGRGITQEEALEVAGGRVWLGGAAKKHGLVDEFGGLNDAIRHAAELAELKTWSIKQVPEAGDFIWEWAEDWMYPSEAKGIMAKLSVRFREISHMNDPKGVYAECPYRLARGGRGGI